MSSFVLKIIAMITMTIDHVGHAIFINHVLLRIIGRIAMPIFAFQIAIGFQKTSSKIKYMLRMLIFALVSQIPFTLLSEVRIITTKTSIFELLKNAFHSEINLNICFTFFIALLVLFLLEKRKENQSFVPIALAVFLISVFVPMDYGWFGVSIVLIFYYFGNSKILYSVLMLLIGLLYHLPYFFLVPINSRNFIQLYMLLSLPFLYLYNGKKGKGLKYLFYFFYPLHMLAIVIIKLFI